jgi:adenylate cyclase
MTTQQTYNTTVAFADVSGSSKLYKELGNDEANRRITDIVNRLMKCVHDNHGVVIKTIGDEVMCHFTRADDACTAAIGFQRIGEETLPIRVGMAWGNVIEKNADLFGQAVNDAAAVGKIARGRQIIVTDQLKQNLSPDNAKKLSVFDEVKLKGGESTSTIYRVDWETHTNIQGAAKQTVIMASLGNIQKQLVISFVKADGNNCVMTLTPKNVPLHIGRDESCQLPTPSPLASRDHCHIDYQYGKFVLVDHSTNGTYLKNTEGQQVYLRRQETPMLGSGEIGLGEQVSDVNQFVIKFQA